MARVHRVESSRTVHRCHAGHDIQPPQGYSWAAPGFRGRKMFACSTHPFRPSQLTTSAVSSVLAAQEALDDELDSLTTHEEFTTAWEGFTQELEQLQSERQEALDAWEHGNSQLEELVEATDAAMDEASGFEVPEFDGDEEAAAVEPSEEHGDEPEEPDRADYESDEDYETDHEQWEEAHTTWENAQSEFEEAVTAHEEWTTWVEETRSAVRDATEAVMGNL